jgi:hypothetical protein
VLGILAHYRGDVHRIITESYKTIDVMQAINRNLPLRSLDVIAGLSSSCKCRHLSKRLLLTVFSK